MTFKHDIELKCYVRTYACGPCDYCPCVVLCEAWYQSQK